MTKRDILDVRTKHAGGRPLDSHTKANERILALIERELKRRRAWGQRLDDNWEIAAAVAGTPRDYREARGQNAETKSDAENAPYAGSFGVGHHDIPGPEAGWRVNPALVDDLAELIAERLKIIPSDIDSHPERVREELDKLMNDPESKRFYFEYDRDAEYDTGKRVHSLDAVVGHIKRFKQEHPEFKTRKRAASKAKPPKS
jgi:hypothetical protein